MRRNVTSTCKSMYCYVHLLSALPSGCQCHRTCRFSEMAACNLRTGTYIPLSRARVRADGMRRFVYTVSTAPLQKHKTLMASLHRGLAFSCLNNHHMSVPLQSPAFRLYQAFHWPATAYGPVQSSLRNHCNIVHFIVGATGLSVITNPKDFTYQTRQSLVARDVKFVGSLLFVLPLFSPFNISSVYESQDK